MNVDQESRPPSDYGWYLTLAQLGTEMVAPIVVGLILDHQLETRPWFTIGGAVLGFVGGFAHLLYVLGRAPDHKGK
jgi:F0F1-type ATP synthase assembly protein I